MKTVPFRLTGEKIHRFGVEYEVAECYDSTAEIITKSNVFFKKESLFKSINCKGHLDCKGVYLIQMSVYKVGFKDTGCIVIGCESRSVSDWELFLSSDEVVNTQRNTVKFALIKADILGAIAMQPIIEKAIRNNLK